MSSILPSPDPFVVRFLRKGLSSPPTSTHSDLSHQQFLIPVISMSIAIYDDQGIRFMYPVNWELDVTEDGAVSTVAVHSPGGPAFFFLTLDRSCPEPKSIAEQALEAMRAEYPTLDAIPMEESIGGHLAFGQDVEFVSLDMPNSCSIRCYRTKNRTVLFFGQWSELEDDTAEQVIQAVRRSLEETDD